MSNRTSLTFRKNAAAALEDQSLRSAMHNATGTIGARRGEAMTQIDFEALRDQASAIRMEVLDNLQMYLDRFTENARKAGAIVHHAPDAEEARGIISDILKGRKAKLVAKSKSMISEEIHLNERLEEDGIEVIETDLGEYIIQLEGESPSHILAPAIHKSRQQVGKLFADKLHCDYTEDPQILTKIARNVLREKFIQADAGISGANFALAESGSIVILTNEGNGRMVTSLPPLHIAVLSIEKMLPSMRDLPTFLRLLPRSATGQTITSYVSIISGTRKAGESTGAKELHIVLLDGGRSDIVKGEFREMLKCIRCSACMNVCPVYRAIGGHAYGWTYPGPMGIILTELLTGLENSHPLSDASTLCGACNEVCPVKIPLMELILRLRVNKVAAGFSPASMTWGMRLFAAAVKSPFLFSSAERLAHGFWPVIRRMGGDDVAGRMPEPSGNPLRRRMK
jgi:L-lactate dehydrogenase complex protein LldF